MLCHRFDLHNRIVASTLNNKLKCFSNLTFFTTFIIMKNQFAFIAFFALFLPFNNGYTLKDNFAPGILTDSALNSLTLQLESTLQDHSRVRRETSDKLLSDTETTGNDCDDKVASCQKFVRTGSTPDCADIYNASKCVFDSYLDSCVGTASKEATAKYLAASYLRGFLSVSCQPGDSQVDEEDERRAEFKSEANKCAAKYFGKIMRTTEDSIGENVCCGNVELVQCISGRFPSKSMRDEFVESSYKRFQKATGIPLLGFSTCDDYPLEKCLK